MQLYLFFEKFDIDIIKSRSYFVGLYIKYVGEGVGGRLDRCFLEFKTSSVTYPVPEWHKTYQGQKTSFSKKF